MDILLFVLDTLRADHLGCYGYPRPTSPVMDSLAAEGILFENCLTNTAHTGPTFATLYTGQCPLTHGVVATLWAHPDEHDQAVRDTTPTLAETIRKAGFLTAAFDNLMTWPSHPVVVARGFDYYVHTNHPDTTVCAYVLAEHINARLLPWLEANRRQRFFAVVHYWDPHLPYNQPDAWRGVHAGKPGPSEIVTPDGSAYIPQWGWKGRLTPKVRKDIDLYDGEISYVDSEIGRVVQTLKRLSIYDETLVIVTADHGEDMEEHNAPFEHREPYEATAHVPLILKPPSDWPAGAPKRVSPIVGHIDLMPSLLDLAGAAIPEGMDGRSWRALLDHPVGALHDFLFITGGAYKEAGRWRTPEIGVRTQTHKYLRRRPAIFDEARQTTLQLLTLCKPREWGLPLLGAGNRDKRELVDYFNSLPREELYSLTDDPCETNNLIEAAKTDSRLAATLDEMRRALDRYIATNPGRR